MSNTDGFIEEVTEEVRREKLYGYLRRYGWIGVLAVLLIVGGAAWNEYRAAQDRAAAEATGDALLDALNEEDAAARTEQIAALTAEGSSAAVVELLKAASLQENGDVAAAMSVLDGLAVNPDVPQMYRDLAAFKAALLPADDSAARLARLEDLAKPGAPFRLLALEQIAFAQLDQGNADAAIATLQSIVEDAAVGRDLRDRAQTLMVALGEPIPDTQTE
ncbi:hypothetical protein [Yoonia sediminilitoris]|uniref:Tetratricopeptide repeat-like domain-containing protein n=1 Tax=Yoonia sediminilitoris TaxID=1286148 RepID=A0A2T6KDX7_9RHOB|nr:hypothetical protein [Yoonia sediminilitoris]PUB13197.1 hypothetical protein C8N45_108118 [Yoonia sediminilitoris]RCW94532.1 hypothetical protein DFP92_108119 [Yoonia sediminilitoris]